ncbi:hypothetical protein [Dielma fastidiosa]|uniref:hypothetical protein n=1 Tax=Dielma fastidiosa TaxID=1034346 RepID=UPI003562221F
MKRYLPIFIIIAIVSFSVGISINANESDSFLTEPISTPWNVNNEEDKEVAAIEFVDEHMNESIPGHKTTTTKLLYILKDGTVITVAVTVSSEAITVVYYHPESELFLLEKYKNDVLVQSLDLSGAFSAGKEEHDSAGILELTEFDKGKFSHNGKLTYLIQRLLYIIYMFSLLIFKLNKKQSFIFLMICDVIMILSCLISLDNRLWYIIASAIIAHSLHFSQFKKKI